MNILFLDDDPARCKNFLSRHPSAVIVHTAQDCIAQLKSETHWDEVHLDHDLGGVTYQDSQETNCGMEVVRWMCLNRCNVRMVIVHSYNAPAAARMMHALGVEGYFAMRIPFAYKT